MKRRTKSVLMLIALFSFSASTFIGTLSADAAPSTKNIFGFNLTSSMTRTGAAQAGAGAFANGVPGAYLEQSCFPVAVELTNGTGATQNLVVDIAYDYQSNGQAIDNLEVITTALSGNPRTAVDDLNDFSFSGSALTSLASAWSTSGTLTATVTGPFANETGNSAISASDTERHYRVTVQDVVSHATTTVLACARLGANLSEVSGASVSVSLGGPGGGNIPINANLIADLPSLTIAKVVSGGSAVPADFSFLVTPGVDGVSASTKVTIPANQASVTLSNVVVSGTQSFAVIEATGPAGYAFSSGAGTNCAFTGSTAQASLTAAVTPTNATCTFTNTKLTQPQLTIVKQVTNDNGGTLTAGDFTINVSGINPSATSFAGAALGTTVTLDPGAYQVTEVGVAGYAGSLSSDCSGTIAFGEARVCTITNDDQSASLTVVTVVDNTAGGALSVGDFLITVNGGPATVGSTVGTTTSINAGAYSAGVSSAANYSSALSPNCSGTLALGETKVCTVTNTYLTPSATQGTLIVQKQVVNDSGFGTKSAADFSLEVHDTNGAVTPVTGSAVGVTVLIDPGQFSVTESADPAYAQTFGAGCSGSIAAGETRTCVVTNDDYPAVLPTTDILPSVQCVAPTDHNTYIAYFGYNNTNGTSVYLPIGNDNSVTGGGLQGNSYGQPEVFVPGASAAYPSSAFSVEFDGSPMTWLLRVAGDSTSALASSEGNELCPTVTPATLRVFADVLNDNGGSGLVLGSTTSTVTSGESSQAFANSAEGHVFNLTPDSFSVASSAVSGYTVSYDAGCTGTISQGESLVCNVLYNDIPAGGSGGGGGGFGGSGSGGSSSATGIILVTHVINDNAGNRAAPEFEMHLRGENPALHSSFGIAAVAEIVIPGSESGVSVALDPGAYSITVSNSSGYTVNMSADCSGTLLPGQVKTCVVTNDDLLPPPTPLVLGVSDEITEPPVAEPVAITLPVPQVLGATDEELPRTGLPAVAVLAWLGGAAYVASRSTKKQ